MTDTTGAPVQPETPINPFTATLLWLWIFILGAGMFALVVGFAAAQSYGGRDTGGILWGGILTGVGFSTMVVWLAVRGLRWQPPTV